ncbi:MAG: RIP metalloprotease RseP [Lachnospiraceae bacterium]|nr:RIP metalloprotease RseP [Lachnospiraceae bacterium]
MKIIIAILVFTIIVVLHELGHFLLAKKNGVGVIEFSVGMGPRLVTVVKTESGFSVKFVPSQKYCESREDWKEHTWYSWKLFPIGGSCMMVGEDEANDAPNSFQKANVWGKIAIIAAGPIFNFLSAFIFAIILISMVGYNPTVVTYVDPSSDAGKAGIVEGDRITAVNGEKIHIGKDFNVYLRLHRVKDEPYTIKYITKKGEKKQAKVSPIYSYYRMGFSYTEGKTGPTVTDVEQGKPMEQAGVKVGDVITGMNGVKIEATKDLSAYEVFAAYLEEHPLTKETVTLTYERNGKETQVEVTPFYDTVTSFQIDLGEMKKGNVLQVMQYSVYEINFWIVSTIRSLGMLVTGGISTNEVSGVVGVVDVIGQTVDASANVRDAILNLLNISILLSANLGVMNLLPFPALDGGRLVFLALEVIRRKPVNQKMEGMVHLIGIILLMILMVLVTCNDIKRIFMR